MVDNPISIDGVPDAEKISAFPHGEKHPLLTGRNKLKIAALFAGAATLATFGPSVANGFWDLVDQNAGVALGAAEHAARIKNKVQPVETQLEVNNFKSIETLQKEGAKKQKIVMESLEGFLSDVRSMDSKVFQIITVTPVSVKVTEKQGLVNRNFPNASHGGIISTYAPANEAQVSARRSGDIFEVDTFVIEKNRTTGNVETIWSVDFSKVAGGKGGYSGLMFTRMVEKKSDGKYEPLVEFSRGEKPFEATTVFASPITLSEVVASPRS